MIFSVLCFHTKTIDILFAVATSVAFSKIKQTENQTDACFNPTLFYRDRSLIMLAYKTGELTTLETKF